MVVYPDRFLLMLSAGHEFVSAGSDLLVPPSTIVRHCGSLVAMLHVRKILCLVASGSAAPAQAQAMASRLGATLHVLPHPVLADTEDKAEVPEVLKGEAPSVPLERPADSPTSLDGILQYVVNEDIDVVVIDTPPERGPVPPLAADATRALVRSLPCCTFVVEHEARPTALKNFLVPTDFSESSLSAFQHAVHLARFYDASVHVLHVVESLPYVALTPTDRLSLGPHPLSEHRGQRRMETFLGNEGAGDVDLHAHLSYGDPADQILRFADRTDIDLVLLSSHGAENCPNTALGQVATRVLGRMTHPLFLVRSSGASLLTPAGEGAE